MTRRKKAAAAAPPAAASSLAIVYRPLAQLIPYARNSRTHDEAQLGQLAASLAEFGWTNPVLLDGQRGIIAGHGRVMAAQRVWDSGREIANCPVKGEVPCIELAGLTEAQKRAYVIADNRLPMSAGWDNEMLAIELGELQALDFDLGLLGFDANELGTLMYPEDGLLPTHTGTESTPVKQRFLVWGKVRVPITPEEEAWLDRAFDEHVAKTTVQFGFVARLRVEE